MSLDISTPNPPVSKDETINSLSTISRRKKKRRGSLRLRDAKVDSNCAKKEPSYSIPSKSSKKDLKSSVGLEVDSSQSAKQLSGTQRSMSLSIRSKEVVGSLARTPSIAFESIRARFKTAQNNKEEISITEKYSLTSKKQIEVDREKIRKTSATEIISFRPDYAIRDGADSMNSLTKLTFNFPSDGRGNTVKTISGVKSVNEIEKLLEPLRFQKSDSLTKINTNKDQEEGDADNNKNNDNEDKPSTVSGEDNIAHQPAPSNLKSIMKSKRSFSSSSMQQPSNSEPDLVNLQDESFEVSSKKSVTFNEAPEVFKIEESKPKKNRQHKRKTTRKTQILPQQPLNTIVAKPTMTRLLNGDLFRRGSKLSGPDQKHFTETPEDLYNDSNLADISDEVEIDQLNSALFEPEHDTPEDGNVILDSFLEDYEADDELGTSNRDDPLKEPKLDEADLTTIKHSENHHISVLTTLKLEAVKSSPEEQETMVEESRSLNNQPASQLSSSYNFSNLSSFVDRTMLKPSTIDNQLTKAKDEQERKQQQISCLKLNEENSIDKIDEQIKQLKLKKKNIQKQQSWFSKFKSSKDPVKSDLTTRATEFKEKEGSKVHLSIREYFKNQAKRPNGSTKIDKTFHELETLTIEQNHETGLKFNKELTADKTATVGKGTDDNTLIVENTVTADQGYPNTIPASNKEPALNLNPTNDKQDDSRQMFRLDSIRKSRSRAGSSVSSLNRLVDTLLTNKLSGKSEIDPPDINNVGEFEDAFTYGSHSYYSDGYDPNTELPITNGNETMNESKVSGFYVAGETPGGDLIELDHTDNHKQNSNGEGGLSRWIEKFSWIGGGSHSTGKLIIADTASLEKNQSEAKHKKEG